MKKTYVTIILGFLVMFAAGAIVGVVQSNTTNHRRHNRSWLADQLHLTDQQRKQMKQIWSDAMTSSRDQAIQERHDLQKQRDAAVRDLLTPQQRTQFEKIEKQYAEASADLQKQRAVAVEDAVQQTKKILNPQQRAEYDHILQQRQQQHADWEKTHRPTTKLRGIHSSAGQSHG